MDSEIGEVSAIAFGGQGIIRQDRLVIFIPFTAVGDRIRYRIVEKKKNYAIGELLDILQTSPHRTVPICPYFGTCGGCQLQHLQYMKQLEYKRTWIEEALNRQAGFKITVPPVRPSQSQWNYRRRIALTLSPAEKFFKAGYLATDNRSLIEVRQCPIFAPKEDPIIELIQQIAKELVPSDSNDGRVVILKSDDQKYLLHFHFKCMPKNAKEVLEIHSKNSAIIFGVLATSANQSFHFGKQEMIFAIEGLTLRYTPKAFIQANQEQSLHIYQAIVAYAEALKPTTVLDLYCGIGISSLLLAKQGIRVVGIESNEEAIRLANLNAHYNRLENIQFRQAHVEQVIGQLLKNESPQMVILNPPREGLLPEICHELKNRPPKTILYISCMPSTLARDLKILCHSTFQVKEVNAFDMFPQTTHLETLVLLEHQNDNE